MSPTPALRADLVPPNSAPHSDYDSVFLEPEGDFCPADPPYSPTGSRQRETRRGWAE